MGVYIDIGRATRVLIEQPKRTINLSQRVALQADINHKNGAMGPGWYVIARLIDKRSGKCFLASAAPWQARAEKIRSYSRRNQGVGGRTSQAVIETRTAQEKAKTPGPHRRNFTAIDRKS